MTVRSSGLRSLLAAAGLLLAACGGERQFVYRPGPAAAGGEKLPVKVAVLPFADGTADFTQSGSIFGSGQFNLAKTGIAGITTALTPEFWAKSFADDLAASGNFRSAAFRYSVKELVDEEFVVEGTVKKAYAAISLQDVSEFDIEFIAVRRADNGPVWTKRVAMEWKTSPDITKGCGANMACVAERCQANTNALMARIFAEARADLLRAVRSRPGGTGEDAAPRDLPPAAGEPAASTTPATPGPDSAEQTIERILKGE